MERKEKIFAKRRKLQKSNALKNDINYEIDKKKHIQRNHKR